MRSLLIAGLLLIGGCTAKDEPGEIFLMTQECFKAKKSIKIEFIPHPQSDDKLDDSTEDMGNQKR